MTTVTSVSGLEWKPSLTRTLSEYVNVLLWGNQQPTWMATLPPEEQLLEIKKWFAAVAARYPA